MAAKLQRYVNRVSRLILPMVVLSLWSLPVLAAEHGGCGMHKGPYYKAFIIACIVYHVVLITLVFLTYKEVKARK